MEFEILNNEITSINNIILLFKELTDLKISLIEHVKNIEVNLINDFNKNLFDYKILLEGYHEDFKKIKLSYYKYGKDAYPLTKKKSNINNNLFKSIWNLFHSLIGLLVKLLTSNIFMNFSFIV